MTLQLNNGFLNRFKIDWIRHSSNSKSFYIGSDSFRHCFKILWLKSELPLRIGPLFWYPRERKAGRCLSNVWNPWAQYFVSLSMHYWEYFKCIETVPNKSVSNNAIESSLFRHYDATQNWHFHNAAYLEAKCSFSAWKPYL